MSNKHVVAVSNACERVGVYVGRKRNAIYNRNLNQIDPIYPQNQ